MAETISFNGLRVLSLESRRSTEMASLIRTYGGEPIVAPSMREVPISENPDALLFADALLRGDFDLVILLTGVGTTALLDAIRASRPIEPILARLAGVPIAVRGPKPAAVLRSLSLTPWLIAPEPNTWRELLEALDARREAFRLDGKRVALQEYGISNPELVEGLQARGARVTCVAVYHWALPLDTAPLEAAVAALLAGEVDVTLLTTATQITHLLQIAARTGHEAAALAALGRTVIGSIGPTTTEGLLRYGLHPDLEPSHPKFGVLVREAAVKAPELRAARR